MAASVCDASLSSVGAKCEQQGSASDASVVLVFRHLEREWQPPFRMPPSRVWAPSANSKVRPATNLSFWSLDTSRGSGSFRFGMPPPRVWAPSANSKVRPATNLSFWCVDT